LQVLNAAGGVVSVLDMRGCLYDAIARLERHLSHATNALSGAMARSGLSSAASAPMVDSLVSKLFAPTLSETLGETLGAVSIPSDVSITEAAAVVRQRRGAVLVHEPGFPAGIAGILTSKDLLFRAVAQGADLAGPVGAIMTRNPDCMEASSTVLQALHQLQYGGYRHVPVVSAGQPLGVLDVLQLIEAALTKQREHSGALEQASASTGPSWRGFWDNAESLIDQPAYVPPTRRTLGEIHNLPSLPGSIQEESEPPSKQAGSRTAGSCTEQSHGGKSAGSGDGSFLFKIAEDGTVHRVQNAGVSIASLRAAVLARLGVPAAMAGSTALLYEDDEADRVSLTTDAELREAVQAARAVGRDRIVLHVKRADAAVPRPRASAAPARAAEQPKPALSAHERVFLIGSAAVMGTIAVTVGALSRAR
jgi:CBS domain-containing protein